MRSALTRIAILLCVMLALANAQCFARCLTQPVDNSAPPCHSHGKAHVAAPQHDLQPSSGPAIAITSPLSAPLTALAEPLLWADYRPPALVPSPPLLPLRI